MCGPINVSGLIELPLGGLRSFGHTDLFSEAYNQAVELLQFSLSCSNDIGGSICGESQGG